MCIAKLDRNALLIPLMDFGKVVAVERIKLRHFRRPLFSRDSAYVWTQKHVVVPYNDKRQTIKFRIDKPRGHTQ